MKKLVIFILPFLAILSLTACTDSGSDTTSTSSTGSNIIYLNQAWTTQDRADYYWGSQGSALISYDIYLALQLANSFLLFNSEQNSDNVGLLTEANAKYNPDNLPIGISKTVVSSGQFAGTYMGMTCAACHTGQIQYQNQQVRIDGGHAGRFNPNLWIRTLLASLEQTINDPARFQLMLSTIQQSSSVNEIDLRNRLKADTAYVKALVEKSWTVPFEPGPGRVDALGIIHNSFTGVYTGIDANLRENKGPVKLPFVWNAPQSAWVQWSGIAPNPIARNFEETLGVFARYNLMAAGENDGLFKSTSDIKGMIKIENLLKRLAPPKWPEDIFGALDASKVQAGEKLFSNHCSSCHSSFPYRWSEARAPGKHFIENALVPLSVIGTDSTQWLQGAIFDPNKVTLTGQLSPYFAGNAQRVSDGDFFGVIAGNEMLNRALASAGPFSSDELGDMTNYASVIPKSCSPQLTYKAGPRDGVWATGPFLHNGSVPNIYELLSPAADRTKKFYVTREFDPIKLGISSTKSGAADYLFDTSLVGNSNAGHSFESGSGSGIIGPEFTPTERFALIEYLKSIPNTAGRVTPYGGPSNPVIASKDTSWFNYSKPFCQ